MEHALRATSLVELHFLSLILTLRKLNHFAMNYDDLSCRSGILHFCNIGCTDTRSHLHQNKCWCKLQICNHNYRARGRFQLCKHMIRIVRWRSRRAPCPPPWSPRGVWSFFALSSTSLNNSTNIGAIQHRRLWVGGHPGGVCRHPWQSLGSSAW